MLTPFHFILAFGMFFTGSVNTISTKAADSVVTLFPDGKPGLPFDHPFVQAALMFIGEMLCLVAFYFMKWRASPEEKVKMTKKFSPWIFALPAMCDMTATSTMYVGLSLTTSSSFQMLRGAVIIFTGILTVLILKRKLMPFHWLGIVAVVVGVVIVGLQDKVCTNTAADASSAPNPTLGNILIIAAQVIVAIQMVLEEKFISKYDVPALQVVGFEGCFGFTILSCIIIAMNFIRRPNFLCAGAAEQSICSMLHLEDVPLAARQIAANPILVLYLGGNVLSIAFFNYFGVSVTKHISAATRMVLDSLRTIAVWGFSLAVKWESFCWIEIIGFIVLLAGTVVYNALVKLPGFSYDLPGAKSQAAEEATIALLTDDHVQIHHNGHHEYEDSATVQFSDLTNTPTMSKNRALKGR